MCNMDIRKYHTDDISSEVAYSDCGLYRYRLFRQWSPEGGTVNFIMLNPSKADEFRNDPTVERCERRARQLGFGAFCVTNIFAWRDTDPKAMRQVSEPIGPLNDDVLIDRAIQSDQIITAWGAHGEHRERGPQVARMLRNAGLPLYHLGLSKFGHPRHPLYISYARSPERWD